MKQSSNDDKIRILKEKVAIIKVNELLVIRILLVPEFPDFWVDHNFWTFDSSFMVSASLLTIVLF